MSARFARRAATATVSLSLVATAAAFAPAAQAAPSLTATFEARGSQAATWETAQLTDGRIHNSEFDFDDWGLTIDTAFALAAADRKKPVRQITRALRANYGSYVGTGGEAYAGSWGKVLVATKVLKQNPRKFGGKNVRANTLKLLTPATGGYERGRASDKSDFGDFSNTLGQSYVVLGLARSGGAPQDSVNYLRKQQCAGGFFREKMVVGKACGPASNHKPSIDATALAVHTLIAAKKHGAKVPGSSIEKAAGWLARHQRANGSFGQGAFGPNANSTGLAGSALWVTGRKGAANDASRWVTRMQLTKANGAKKRDRGAIAYNVDARNAATKDGITKITRDQFQRATPQAMLTLYRVSLATLTK
jgi:hypothetical protein